MNSTAINATLNIDSDGPNVSVRCLAGLETDKCVNSGLTHEGCTYRSDPSPSPTPANVLPFHIFGVITDWRQSTAFPPPKRAVASAIMDFIISYLATYHNKKLKLSIERPLVNLKTL